MPDFVTNNTAIHDLMETYVKLGEKAIMLFCTYYFHISKDLMLRLEKVAFLSLK